MPFIKYFLFLPLLALSGVLFPGIGNSQTSNLYFKHLTPDDGLTQSVINDIYTDSKGFVWMTGLDGINRFDGLRCLANDEIASGLNNPGKTKKILEDKNGDIWFGYNEGVIQYSYHSNRFETYKIPQRQVPGGKIKKPEYYYPLACDHENNLLIGGSDKTVLLYNTKTSLYQFYDQPVDSVNSVTFYFPPALSSLKEGWKWVLQKNDSIYVCTLTAMRSGKAQWSKSGFSLKGRVESLAMLFMQDDHTLFFYTNGRIGKYQFLSGKFSFSPEIKIGDIYLLFTPDAKGNLWISETNNGLQILDTATMKLLSYSTYNDQNSNGFSSNKVAAYIDRNQMLWLAAWGKGVDYANLNEERFTSFLTTANTKIYGYSNFIRGIVESPGGDFYCSTQSGIIVLDENLRFKKKLPGNFADAQYPDLCLLRDKLYYVCDAGLSEGLYQYDLRNGNAVNLTAGKNLRPYQISITKDNDLLVASMNGLWKFDPQKARIEALRANGSPADIYGEVVYGYRDKQQQVYKCINNLGFVVYRSSGDRYNEAFVFDKNITVKQIVAEDDSLVWMATSGGLYLFNTLQLKMIKHFTTAQGLPDNVVYAIIADEKNNLWLSTNKGLSYFNVPGNRFINFTQEDGLQANEFNTHAVLKTRDGRIIFGGVNGLTVVNPRVLTAKLPPPVLQITALKSDSICNPFLYDQKGAVFMLNAGTNSFETEITAISFRNPALCKIKYRLKNYDNDWLITSNPGTVHYSRLPPGKYILEVMASNARGEFGGEVKQLVIWVKAYWWKTTWFKIVALAFLLLLEGLSAIA